MRREDIVAAVAGVLFGLGLSIAQMTDPNKVLNFLDLAGQWDPSLILVMGAALLVVMPAYRLLQRQGRSLLGGPLHFPTRTDLDARLIAGAAMFGIGWGLSGYCPGPALTSLATLSLSSLAIVAAMIAGMWLHDLSLGRRAG
ncbi:DUF6691 family protein [Sinimarinibacterium thermocellulolyticum]|uniref:DUF6691 family protein n=1 Tax=Sinimarinibacterium thermocellulolyticum TaxID=3170016 RepID=A0ABV2ABT9_9GAMM